MTAFDEAADLREAAMGGKSGSAMSADTISEREENVRRGFWAKLKHVAGNVPFAEDLIAAYYCAMDPATPVRVRGMLLAALAYFIMPFDILPDMVVGLGYADDMALLTAVVGLVSASIKPVHRAAAARALGKALPERD